jgi:hypothetical protein
MHDSEDGGLEFMTSFARSWMIKSRLTSIPVSKSLDEILKSGKPASSSKGSPPSDPLCALSRFELSDYKCVTTAEI